MALWWQVFKRALKPKKRALLNSYVSRSIHQRSCKSPRRNTPRLPKSRSVVNCHVFGLVRDASVRRKYHHRRDHHGTVEGGHRRSRAWDYIIRRGVLQRWTMFTCNAETRALETIKEIIHPKNSNTHLC